jgi:dsDNA-specific endonuclease/ATPase MutS2
MTAKLTLSIDSKIIEKAKKYAKKEGKSLSSMVEDFLAFSVKDTPNNKSEYLETVEKLAGSLKNEVTQRLRYQKR